METRDHLDAQQLYADVSRRVRPLCEHLPHDEIDALVARIVHTELRFRTAADGMNTAPAGRASSSPQPAGSAPPSRA